jgi:hypothetical protein
MSDIYSNALNNAEKMAANAKDGNLKLNGKTYVLTFNHKTWTYTVTENGNHVMDLNEKRLKEAKKYLTYWLNN